MTAARWLELWSERMNNYAHLAMSSLSAQFGNEVQWIQSAAAKDFPQYRRRWELCFWHYRRALERVRLVNQIADTIANGVR
jgi:hypothetical protein